MLDADNTLVEILEWAWLSLVALVTHIYRKITGLETQSMLLKQQQETLTIQREEDLKRRETERGELRDSLSRLHTKFDSLSDHVHTK